MPITQTINDEDKVMPYVLDTYTQDSYMYGYHSSYHSNSSSRVFNKPLVTEDRPESHFFMGSEIELAFRSSSDRSEFCDHGSNWYCCENDGSLSGAAPMELITIPLHPDDATNPDFWRPLTKVLSAKGARSWTNNSTGHHVHVSRSLFCNPNAALSTQYRQMRTAVGKLTALYALFIEDNPAAHRVFGRKTCYNQVKMKDSTLVKFTEAVPDLLVTNPKAYQILVETVRNANSRRTCEINTLNRNTIEFRMGKGSLCPERIAAINEFVLLFCKWSMQVRLNKECTLDSFEKYMNENVRENSWLPHFYFNTPSPDGKRTSAPNPRDNGRCSDDEDM